MAVINANGAKWRVDGVNIISSDEIYKKIVHAIKNNLLTQQHLQSVTGHRSPIIIDFDTHRITFCSF